MKLLPIALIGFAITAAGVPLPAAAAEDVPPYKGDGGVVRMTNNQAGTNAFAFYTIQKFKLERNMVSSFKRWWSAVLWLPRPRCAPAQPISSLQI